ncbi:MAG: serine/threonine-protein kinase [Phycisphaerae bacterium]
MSSSGSETLEIPGYQVMQYLGSGARSTIWQIKESRTGKIFALKRVVKRQVSDTRFLEQAENEYQVAQGLDHATIRRIYKIRRVKRWLSLREIHLIMEYCQGRTIQEARPKAILQVIEIFRQVADALFHVNQQGFVHGDMKPNNILVGPDGKTAKIIDLGQSCPNGTIKQRIQGTPDFIAPEQVHRKPLDARTDVYNFGAALYWTLTGKPIPTVLPKKAEVPQISDLAVTPPEELNPGVPETLSKLVLDCIQLRPADRPVSMEKVGSRLSLIAYMLTRTDDEAVDPSAESLPGHLDSQDSEALPEGLDDTYHGPMELPADAIPDSVDQEHHELDSHIENVLREDNGKGKKD